MIALLSPAKTVRSLEQSPIIPSRPALLSQACTLAEIMKEYSPWELESLLHVNPALGFKAFESYQSWNSQTLGTPAILAYNGLVYRHLAAEELSAARLEEANQRLCLLSALYGVLRPTDGILPYRLEMSCPLKPDGFASLYDFWGDRLYRCIQDQDPVINLASNEYASALRPYAVADGAWIDIIFLFAYKGRLKTIVAWAKMARGRMARYIVDNAIDRPEGLLDFRDNACVYRPDLSDRNRFVFVGQPPL